MKYLRLFFVDKANFNIDEKEITYPQVLEKIY